jgi:hypothetical protein
MLARLNIVAQGSTFQHLRTAPGRSAYPCVFAVDSTNEGIAEDTIDMEAIRLTLALPFQQWCVK